MKNKPVNSQRVPIYRDAGFELFDADTAKAAFARESENERVPELYIYSRYRNPTVVAAEEEVMKLEDCKWALLTQTGMSAVDTALSVFQRRDSKGPWLFFSEIYGGTLSYIDSILRNRRGLEVFTFNPVDDRYDYSQFEETLKSLKPELVYIEAVSNPMLIVTDIESVISISHKYGAMVIVDNTFATPLLCKPLGLGADLVIHSATKYFSGHGNISAGVLCGNDPGLMKAAVEYRKYVGHMISPDDAYRLHTQIQTLKLRFSQQCSNASNLAELFTKESGIRKVWYPGLKNHPTHSEAVRLFRGRGFGGMITIDFEGASGKEKKQRRDEFINGVAEKIKIVPSLGDPRTMILPVESVWGAKYPEPGMLRLSVGFEEYNELEGIIMKALRP